MVDTSDQENTEPGGSFLFYFIKCKRLEGSSADERE